MAQPRQPPSSAGVAAGAAATVAVPAAGAAAGAAGAGVASSSVPIAAGAIVAALISFLAQQRTLHEQWLRDNLGKYGQGSDIAAVIAQEMRYEADFAQGSADRLASALPQALAIADPIERQARVRQLLADEQRYAAQRSEAMIARAIAAVTRGALRRSSPLGAFWRLGHAHKHTEGCMTMANRFWPWAVLNRVHPPRHHGCTSTLHGFGEAVHAGWMTAGDVPDTRTAVRLARGVMMEGDADRLLAELDLRDRLVEAGVERDVLDLTPLEGIDPQALEAVSV